MKDPAITNYLKRTFEVNRDKAKKRLQKKTKPSKGAEPKDRVPLWNEEE